MFFIKDWYPEGEPGLSEHAPARPRRRKVHPLSWFVAAALMPLLVWDVWQTLQDVKHRHQAYASDAGPPATARFRAHFD